ncbi:taurine dioxygenase [Novosphingobium sp. CF614]|uniref:TauD/TfdA dioxygenase family protein n=1 Tax=Novosphingobium sp. CF614 TaxID=1884364 RepID=UPI0008E0E5FE|nr:TauD/TfdA family dioxygenase [Novosphingobium sp. CF614]SFF96568.1 taurine dioxygenase [Novosphingobium sp. CF614]
MASLQVKEIRPGFGAEISGVEPKVPLPDDVIAQLRQLFDERGLLVFRDIDADLRFQTYLSLLLIGEDPLANPAESLDSPAARRELLVSNREEGGNAPVGRLLYHSDYMWRDDVFRLLSLYGLKVEQPTSPTMFVSAAHGWDTLPDDLRARVEGLYAIHGQDASYQQRSGGDADVLVSKFDEAETIRLPIGHRHPRTGRTILYVTPQFTQRIDGMEEAESEALLGELFDHLYRPEAEITHQWRERDLVMWDNIALQHARPNVTYEGPARTLRKTFAPPPSANASKRPRFTTVGA